MPKELRVHGVSGTPPGDLLYTAPVTYDQGTDLAKVFETSRDHWQTKAFHWGSLTSKSPLSALWILLAPFAMANVAGWMSEGPNLWSRIWIRVAGLSLTGILAAQLANVALDIPYSVGTSQTAVTWMLAVLAVLFIVGLGLLSTQSTFRRLSFGERMRYLLVPSAESMHPTEREEHDWSDPAEGAQVTGPTMWGLHSVLHRLRRLHLAFGAAVIALVAARAVDDSLAGAAAIGLAGVVMITLALTTGPTAGSRIVLWVTAIAPAAGVAIVAWSIVGLATGEIPTSTLQIADDVTFEIALLLGIAAGFGLVGEAVLTRGRGGWVPTGLLAVAALIGGTLGLTGAMLIETFLSDTPSTTNTFDGGAAFVTIGSLGLVITIAVTFGVSMFKSQNGGPTWRLRTGVLRARTVLQAAAVYGTAVGAAAVLLSCDGPEAGCTQSNIELPNWMVESADNTVVFFGLPFDPASPLGWAKLLMVAVPAALIVRSVVGGLLNGEDSRRQVGILWDLGSFWPRWFHPLAPPAYGPYAVKRLKRILDDEEPDVLAAHSQGSLISAVALALDQDVTTPGLFITYGSQVGELYPRLFPTVGLRDMIIETNARVGDAWVNLWRPSDSIGGQVIAEIGERNWQVETGRGHSRYELTPEFCAARETVSSPDLHRPPDNDIGDCWETS